MGQIRTRTQRHLRLVAPETVFTDVYVEWELWMTTQGLARRTISERIRVVRQASRSLAVEPTAFTAHSLQIWLSSIRNASSRDSYYSALQAWSRWLVQSDRRVDDPTIKVPRPRVRRGTPRPVATEHVAALLALPMQHATRSKILLAAYAGLRVSEIAEMSGRWVDRVASTLRVRGKGGSDDVIPLHPVLKLEAEHYPRRGYWFPSPYRPGKPVKGASVSNVISDAFARIGVDATAHQLRHWFASTLLAEGVDVRVVQELLRHKSLNTTAIYTQVPDRVRREALSRLPRPHLPYLGHLEGPASSG